MGNESKRLLATVMMFVAYACAWVFIMCQFNLTLSSIKGISCLIGIGAGTLATGILMDKIFDINS